VEVQSLVVEPGRRVGDGELPAELGRVNWGAALTTGLWAVGHALWWWVLTFLALSGLSFGAFTLLDRSSAGDTLWMRYALAFAFSLLRGVLAVVLALRANSLYWDAQASRVMRQSDQSVPRPAPLVSDFVKAQRKWTIWGAVLLVLFSARTLIGYRLNTPLAVFYISTTILPEAVVLAGLYIYDRVRGPAPQSEQALPADSGSR